MKCNSLNFCFSVAHTCMIRGCFTSIGIRAPLIKFMDLMFDWMCLIAKKMHIYMSCYDFVKNKLSWCVLVDFSNFSFVVKSVILILKYVMMLWMTWNDYLMNAKKVFWLWKKLWHYTWYSWVIYVTCMNGYSAEISCSNNHV